MSAEGLSLDEAVHRHAGRDEALPWDHISAGLHRDFLWQDWLDALAEHGLAGLPVDPLLRLRGLHRLRASSTWWPRRSPGRRQPGDRARTSRLGPGAGRSTDHRMPTGAVRPRAGRPMREAACGPERARLSERVRFRFAKLGKIRFTSHRDVARMWERALRRAGLPVAYIGGFSPRPQLSFGLALPTGRESLAEYLDVDVAPGPAGGAGLDCPRPACSARSCPTGIDVPRLGGSNAVAPTHSRRGDILSWELEVQRGDRRGASGADRAPARRADSRRRYAASGRAGWSSDDLRPSVLV